ncbi:hypothetical protein M501DRAFT_1017496 [Patellaria atrata CBS 101060]|uniref:Uncharacterized protein n=1 Tax=Patellaria atrata CBS 101060 TaxID=1346257 RepID=A0A9P4S9G4_9PEZI|nr:hypothetical protein M501DRAFT_1017496 [Patellaria atrata CBS 101060]
MAVEGSTIGNSQFLPLLDPDLRGNNTKDTSRNIIFPEERSLQALHEDGSNRRGSVLKSARRLSTSSNPETRTSIDLAMESVPEASTSESTGVVHSHLAYPSFVHVVEDRRDSSQTLSRLFWSPNTEAMSTPTRQIVAKETVQEDLELERLRRTSKISETGTLSESAFTDTETEPTGNDRLPFLPWVDNASVREMENSNEILKDALHSQSSFLPLSEVPRPEIKRKANSSESMVQPYSVEEHELDPGVYEMIWEQFPSDADQSNSNSGSKHTEDLEASGSSLQSGSDHKEKDVPQVGLERVNTALASWSWAGEPLYDLPPGSFEGNLAKPNIVPPNSYRPSRQPSQPMSEASTPEEGEQSEFGDDKADINDPKSSSLSVPSYAVPGRIRQELLVRTLSNLSAEDRHFSSHRDSLVLIHQRNQPQSGTSSPGFWIHRDSVEFAKQRIKNRPHHQN